MTAETTIHERARGFRWGRLCCNIERALDAIRDMELDATLLDDSRRPMRDLFDQVSGLQQRAWEKWDAARRKKPRTKRKKVSHAR